jgi:hypothetical protein
MRFEGYANPCNGYTVHCHLLTHEDSGVSTVHYVEPPPHAGPTKQPGGGTTMSVAAEPVTGSGA